MNIVRKALSKEEILSKVDDWAIFRHYVGEEFQINRSICSIFRKDRNPSMSIYLSEDGKLRYIDFADDKYKGDAVDLVEQLYNLDYPNALQKIALDFQLTSGKDDYKKIIKDYNKPIITQKKYTFIQINARKFNEKELQYWQQYHITKEDLYREQIYAVKELWVNRRKRFIADNELCFAYHFPEGFKVYFPLREKGKRWISSVPLTTIEGEIIKDKVLVTKSRKDRIVMSKLLPHFSVISVQNESKIPFTEHLIQQLSGKEVYINFDGDKTGKSSSMAITTEFNFKHLNTPDYLLPGIKDFSDWVKEQGTEPVIEFLKLKKLL